MNNPYHIFHGEFSSAVTEAESYCFFTRAIEKQRENIETLENLKRKATELKDMAVTASDEDNANRMMGFEFCLDSLSSQLKMWVLLKEERHDLAWDALVSAQYAALDAQKSHRLFARPEMENLVSRLLEIERTSFPPQVFVSSAFIVERQECSICGSEYGECQHVIGRPYMGKICHVNALDLVADHVAIVKVPADKRCRMLQIIDGNRCRNAMTWRMEQDVIQDEG